MASSLIETQARAYRRNGVMKVETVDLAAELQAQLSPLVGREKAVLLKLDVEGAEYDLLSHLLMRGALCLLDYIIVEWHLNSLTPERRLAGLGLQLSLGDMLARGCPVGSRPREVTINAEVENNAGMPVPGLAEEMPFPLEAADAIALGFAASWDAAGARDLQRLCPRR